MSPKPQGPSPTEVCRTAISPHGPPQDDPGHPATQEADGRLAPVSQWCPGPIQCLWPGSDRGRPAQQEPGPNAHSQPAPAGTPALTHGAAKPQPHPVHGPIRPPKGLGREGPNAPARCLYSLGSRDAHQGPPARARAWSWSDRQHRRPRRAPRPRSPETGRSTLTSLHRDPPPEQKAAPGAPEDRSTGLAHGQPPARRNK
ncbi:hypothetical protein NDU88_007155 [Pleurodeles waltl]|uniref:Uncharacterized protein n=1 Tax=Pleurodeles waltl TaxID=8319 RepID=A0AAV7UN27_PLEWA|nr:hypothetical protein NDU88_007155 [Pleurodeles waltl]